MADSNVSNKVIKTQRLTLREARQFDLAAMHALYSNKVVMQFWYASLQSVGSPPEHTLTNGWGRRSPSLDSIARTQTYLDIMVKSPSNGTLAFMIILPPSASATTTSASAGKNPITTPVDEGKLIGHAGIWTPTSDNELVFMIDNAYWNQGYMTEVLETLVPIFWEKGLWAVHADVEPKNEASVWLLRKMGFQQVGQNTVECYEGICDSMRMELRNPE